MLFLIRFEATLKPMLYRELCYKRQLFMQHRSPESCIKNSNPHPETNQILPTLHQNHGHTCILQIKLVESRTAELLSKLIRPDILLNSRVRRRTFSGN